MVVRVVEFSSGGYKIGKSFALNINIHIMYYIMEILSFKNWCQKLGIIFENNVISKLMLLKNGNNKKCASKLIFLNEKKLRVIPMIFT